MKKYFIATIILIWTATTFGQIPEKLNKKMGSSPVFFLDSVQIDMDTLWTISPLDISNIRILIPRKAKKILGDKGVDGAVYVTTVKFARSIYWTFFSSRSSDYKELLKTPESDTIVQYVLNGEALSDSAAPGSLVLVDKNTFKSLAILDKEKLLSDDIIPKRYLVAITAKRPKGLLKFNTHK
jgi:hypothetical protein